MINQLKFAKAEISQVADVKAPKSQYYRHRVKSNKTPYWMLNITSSKTDYIASMGASAKLDSMLGEYTLFPINSPFPTLNNQPNAKTNASYNKDISTITLKGLLANQVGAVVAGEFIQFSSHQKVYRVTDTSNSGGTGLASINFTPALVSAVAIDEDVSFGEDCVFQVCLDKYHSMEIDANQSKYCVFDLQLIEQG